MTSLRGCGRLCKDKASVALSIAPTSQGPSHIDSEMDELKGPSAQGPSAPSSALSLAPEPSVVLFTTFSTVKYLKDNLQCIFKTFIQAKTPAAPIAPPKDPRERPLKARFPTYTAIRPTWNVITSFNSTKTILAW